MGGLAGPLIRWVSAHEITRRDYDDLGPRNTKQKKLASTRPALNGELGGFGTERPPSGAHETDFDGCPR